MLCRRCESVARIVPGSPAADLYLSLTGGKRLQALLCERCGGVLPALDPTDALLGQISLLARFGLNSGDRPLLGLGRSVPATEL
jgi:hypothetical protein